MDLLNDDISSICRVSPFRHLRITAYVRLPEAFRSLSRLSSALSAKASALRPSLLNLFIPAYRVNHDISLWELAHKEDGMCWREMTKVRSTSGHPKPKDFR